jgi:hypothetical protein
MTDDIKTFLHITKESLLYDYRDRKSIEEEVKKEQLIIRHNTSVTNFTKFIKNEILDKISILVDQLFITISPIEEKNIVLFPNDIQTSSSTFEEVFDIIGVTLPSMLEIKTEFTLYTFPEEAEFVRRTVVKVVVNAPITVSPKILVTFTIFGFAIIITP